MASLTLKDIPDELLEGAGAETDPLTTDQQLDKKAQIAAWRELAGKWSSDQTVEQELNEIYEARTTGREVSLEVVGHGYLRRDSERE